MDETVQEPEQIESSPDPEAPAAEASETPPPEAVEGGEGAGEAGAGPEPEAPQPTPEEWFRDPAKLREMAEKEPAFQQWLEDKARGAVQRRELELKRQAGSRENVARLTEQALRHFEENPDRAKADLTLVADLALGHAHDQALRTIAKLALDYYEVEPHQRSVVERAVDTLPPGEGLADYAATILNAAVQAQVAKERAKLEAEIDRKVSAKVQAELKAKAVQAQSKNPTLPAAPKGQGRPWLGPTPTEYLAATPAQRREWAAKGIEVVPPTTVNA